MFCLKPLLKVCLSIWLTLDEFWQIFNAVGHIFILVSCQIMTKQSSHLVTLLSSCARRKCLTSSNLNTTSKISTRATPCPTTCCPSNQTCSRRCRPSSGNRGQPRARAWTLSRPRTRSTRSRIQTRKIRLENLVGTFKLLNKNCNYSG